MKQNNWRIKVGLITAIVFLSGFSAFGQIGPDSLAVLKDLAKNGKPSAMYQLGVIYEEGRYEKQNVKRAISYFNPSIF